MKWTRKRVAAGLAGLVLAGGVAIGGAAAAAAAAPGPGPGPGDSTAAPCPDATGPGGHRGGMPGAEQGRQAMAGGEDSPIAAAADYLGLSRTDLRTRLQTGTSLADVAVAQGKSVTDLQDSMATAIQTRLDANTTLTDQQKTEALRRAKERLAVTVNTTHQPGADHGSANHGGHGHGPMGPHGSGTGR